jgi:tetratricopeptide (TPR) repeat protein
VATTKETLISLHLEGFSGKVTIRQENLTKAIFFKKGQPIYVDSNVRSETLGQLLLEQKKLTESQYMMVLDKMEKTSRRQGDCIVELGYMSGYEVYEALKDQMGRKFENVFLMENADIVAEEGERYLINIQEFPIDLFRICLDSAYSSQLGFNEELFPQDAAVVLSDTGKKYLQSKSLQAREMKIIRLMDGKVLWPKIIESSVGEEETLAGIVETLQNFKFLESRTPIPKSFKVPASEVAKDPESPPQTQSSTQPSVPSQPKSQGSRVIEIGTSATPKNASPIYTVALKIDQPYHRLLGVTHEMNRFQIKKNYDQIIREFHLDAISENYGESERKVAESVFDRVTLAFTVLNDDKRRLEYFKNLPKTKPGETAEVPKKVLAEMAVQKKNLFVAKRRLDDAEAEIHKAIELDPAESSYHVELAEILMMKSAHKKEAPQAIVEQELKAALKLNSSDPEAFFQLGVYFKIKGEMEKARGAFMKVVDARPNHPKASAELRLINKRLEGKHKGESTILKLFKKVTEKTEEGKKASKEEDDEES